MSIYEHRFIDVVKIDVNSIEYDVSEYSASEIEEIDLPNNLSFEVSIAALNHFNGDVGGFIDFITEQISDETGFLVRGYSLELDKGLKNPTEKIETYLELLLRCTSDKNHWDVVDLSHIRFCDVVGLSEIIDYAPYQVNSLLNSRYVIDAVNYCEKENIKDTLESSVDKAERKSDRDASFKEER